jgi:hypothetical protein
MMTLKKKVWVSQVMMMMLSMRSFVLSIIMERVQHRKTMAMIRKKKMILMVMRKNRRVEIMMKKRVFPYPSSKNRLAGGLSTTWLVG